MDFMKKLKYGLVMASLCVPTVASAAVFGDYDRKQRSNFDVDSQQNLNTYSYTYPMNDAHGTRIGYICTDTNLVPGKLVNGYCYVELNGNDWRNSDYYVLKAQSATSQTQYRLLEVQEWWRYNASSAQQFIRQYGVTSGAMLGGEFQYHCYVKEGHTGRSAFGHYNPALNKCHYELHGDRSISPNDYTVTDMEGWEVSVLVEITPFRTIPSGMSYGTDLNAGVTGQPGGGSGGGGGGGNPPGGEFQ